MPTIFAHALIPIAVAVGLGKPARNAAKPPSLARISWPLMLAGIAAAMLPDADVIAFRLGIPYADTFGHRGASHSILFALLLGAMAALLHRPLRSPAWLAGGFIAISAISHPLLDMLTNGGHGVALYWPWSPERHFAPWQVIEVSPIGRNFFSARGLAVLKSEALWIGLPCLLLALALRTARRPLAAASR